MPSVKLSPLFNDEQLDNNGIPLSGGKVYWYLAGTTTPAATYTDSTGVTPQTNPVVLNSRGEPDNPIWLEAGVEYKAIIKDALDNTIRTIDNISGVNDTSIPTISEWVLFGSAANYVNTTQFSVTGDSTATFTVNRRVKAVGTGTIYGTITASTYAAGSTTVTIRPDSGTLDSGLSQVYYGFIDPTFPSIKLSNFKIGQIIRAMSSASGTEAVIGLGFTPRLIRFFWIVDGALTAGQSQCNSTTTHGVYIRPDTGVYETTTNAVVAVKGSGLSQTAVVTSLDTNGFTLTWTKLGSPTGVLYLNWEAVGW